MSAVTVEAPLPATPGQDAYSHAADRARTLARQRAEQAEADRREHLAAIDDMHAWVVNETLTALRREAELAERLFWGRVRTLALAVAVDPERLTLTSTIGDNPQPVIAALLDELSLYGAELDAQPYRRRIALAALDTAWVNGRRAYLAGVA